MAYGLYATAGTYVKTSPRRIDAPEMAAASVSCKLKGNWGCRKQNSKENFMYFSCSCILNCFVLDGYETCHSQTSWHCQKNIPFFRSPKEISPAVPMECAEHPIATPRTKGEDLAEHISTNQEGYRVSEWCCRGCFSMICYWSACYCDCFGLWHQTHHPSWDVLWHWYSWKGATWRTARHAMSHARKTGKAFKRLLPKEAPIHLGEMGSYNRKTSIIETWSFEL